MLEFLSKLFDTSDFPARWYCGNWTAGHGWLHILSDTAIWAAFFAIPGLLAYFTWQRRDFPFRSIVFLFVAFTMACGTTHLMEAVIFWWPAYRLAGIIKLITAVVSWATLFVLAPAIPVALSLRGPKDLEREVTERTRALAEANERLSAEISRRRKMEEEIRDHREWLEVTLQSIGDGVIATDREGRVTLMNPIAQDLTGWTAEAGRGRPLAEVFQIINETTRRRVENPVELVLRDGKTVGLANHTVLIARDGVERPIDDSAAPILTPRGEILGAVLVFRDVTEQRRIEWERLRLASIVESSEDAIVGKTLDGIITTWNAGAERLYGYKAEEIIGKSLEVLSPPDRYQDVREVLAALRAGTPTRQIETVRRRKDGRLVDVSLRLSLVRNTEGEIIGISGIDRDISERKAADRRRNVRLSVAQVLAEEATLADAAPRLVKAVCRGLHWDIGALWIVDSESNALRCLEFHNHSNLDCDELLELTYNTTFAPGVGLPGRMWETREPFWIVDIAAESDEFPRKAAALRCGLRTAVAGPIVVGAEFLGVLEFLSREPYDPDIEQQEILATLGGQIGQFIVRRRAVQILRDNEERLRLALEAGRMGTWEWRIPENTVKWSPSLEAIHGLAPGTFPGTFEAFQKDIHPDDHERVLAAIQDSVDQKREHHLEYRLVWTDGSIHWVEARGQLFRGGHDRPERMIGICMDITHRKKLEQQLHDRLRELSEAEIRIRTIVDNVLDGIITIDEQGTVVSVNHSAEKLFGYSAEEVVGRNVTMLMPEPERGRHSKSLQNYLRTGQPRVIGIGREVVGRRKDGTEFPMDLGVGEFRLDHRRFFTGIVRDITRRKQDEQVQQFLLDASRSLASLVDYESTMRKVSRLAIPFFADWCAVYMPDEHGRLRQLAVAHMDPAKMRLAGELDERYPPNPEFPVGAGHVFRTGRAQMITEITEAAFQAAARDEEHLRSLKELAPRSFIGVPLSVRGKILGVMTFLTAESGRNYTEADLAVAEDLAHRVAVAIENARLYAEVREADRRKDEFLAMLAHELRNPLAPIRTGLDVLALSGVEPESVELMQQQVEHLVRLVDDLLDVSRIMRGKIQLDIQPLDLSDVVRRAIEMSHSYIEEQHHQLTVELSDEPVWVQGDGIRLTQVVTNLLNNAAKYTDPGGQISVRLTRENGSAVLRVRDNGIGIDPDLLPHVFELFTQADRTADRAQGGLGIGLTLVLRMIEMHGGTVTAESAGTGRGSLFTVRLPLQEPAEVGQPAGERKPVAIPARKVLIVDDNAAAARMLEVLLARVGEHEVHVAHDGPEALQVVEEFQPDIIFLDIGLPGMNGYEVAAKLRNRPATQNTFLVALTGYGQSDDRRRSLEAGFDEHLVKPPAWEAIERLLADPRLSRRTVLYQPPSKEVRSALPPAQEGPQPAESKSIAQENIEGGQAGPVNGTPIGTVDRRNRFLAKLTHEIGNLVAPVQMMYEILERVESPPPAVEVVCGMLQEQVPAIKRLITELQGAVRVLRADWQLDPQDVQISKLVDRVTGKIRADADGRKVELAVDSPAAPVEIEGDPDLLEEALDHLLQNAVDATRPGDRIELTWQRRDDEVVLSVTDTGVGITPELLPHVFEPFDRAGQAPDFAEGRLGVGLTFVRQVIEQHGGTVELHSEGPGRGSRFIARLPIRLPEAGKPGVHPDDQ